MSYFLLYIRAEENKMASPHKILIRKSLGRRGRSKKTEEAVSTAVAIKANRQLKEQLEDSAQWQCKFLDKISRYAFLALASQSSAGYMTLNTKPVISKETTILWYLRHQLLVLLLLHIITIRFRSRNSLNYILSSCQTNSIVNLQ